MTREFVSWISTIASSSSNFRTRVAKVISLRYVHIDGESLQLINHIHRRRILLERNHLRLHKWIISL